MDIVRPASQRSASTLKRRVPFIAGGLAIVAVFGFSWMKISPASAAPSVERASSWTEHVKRGDLMRQVPVQGTLVPEHVQWLSATTAARVAKIVVRPGAQVEADTVVLVLENTDLELAALDAERQAASAEARLIETDVKMTADEKQQASAVIALKADLREADHHAGDANRLSKEGIVSENERRDANEKVTGMADRFGSEQARHEVIASGRTKQLIAQRAEIDRLREIAVFRRKQLAAMEVRAGVRGVVQDVPLENGQWVAIGTLLAKIAEPGRLKADVKVAETYARDVHKGLAVRFEGSGANCRGSVERVDPSVVGGYVRIEVTLDESLPAGARVDQNVSGFIEIEKLDNVLYVARPSGALDGVNASVFRLDADHLHASRVTVQFGRGSTRDVEIVGGGLSEGDEIVVSDTSSWEASSRVRLQ